MKTKFTNKRAFTLIELLIVIAIIGILFIVLVSKVDFATDKAKATGVQTDFRSFQMALDTVAKENAGFNTFGWDTGDANANGKRDSYDEGDTNKDGIQNGSEVFTGHKVYAETFTKVYSLVKPGTTGYDRDALNRLETAINANLDPKLHITIKDDGEIVMANGAQDPWNKEYHGAYITNAEVDKKDRGAIVIYSDGANNEFGSEHVIANGVVTISIPGSNKFGKDDYSLVSCYTFTNGYGEVLNMSTGFSNNQVFVGNTTNSPAVVPGNGGNNAGGNAGGNGGTEPDVNEPIPVVSGATFSDGTTLTWEKLKLSENSEKYGYNAFSIGDTYIGEGTFEGCTNLTSIVIPDSVTSIGEGAFYECTSLSSVTIGNRVTSIGESAFEDCTRLISVTIPDSVTEIGKWAFCGCVNLKSVPLGENVTSIGEDAFYNCTSLTSIVIPDSVTYIGYGAFYGCNSLPQITVSENNENYKSIDGNLYTKDGKTLVQYAMGKTNIEFTIPDGVTSIGDFALNGCNLTSVVIGDSVTRIGIKSFWGCSVSSVTISTSVTSIEASAFDSCSNLVNIVYRGTVSQWSAVSLGAHWHIDSPATYVQCSNGQVNI